MTCACGHEADEHDRLGECQIVGCDCFAIDPETCEECGDELSGGVCESCTLAESEG